MYPETAQFIQQQETRMKTSDKQIQLQTYANDKLVLENQQYINTGGISENNRNQGFVPAFLDVYSGAIYRSCFANGLPAPIHILSVLPKTIQHSAISGFLLKDVFYTREQAAIALKRLH